MARTLRLAAAVVILALPSFGAVPAPITPASSGGEPFVTSACPTFHWAGTRETGGVELAVWRAEEQLNAVPVLAQVLPTGARLWTPSLADCFEAGVYVWAVRAVAGEGAAGWSSPVEFRVARRTSRVRTNVSPRETPEPRQKAQQATASAPLPEAHEYSVAEGGAPAVDNLELAESFEAFAAGTAAFQLDQDASILGDLAVGADESQAALHVRSQDIEIPAFYVAGDDVIVEGADAVLGIYSSEAGVAGSAVALGETFDGSFITGGKWGIARGTNLGTGDGNLRFTFGSGSNYFTNETQFEIDNDGSLDGRGVAVGWAAVDVTDSTTGEFQIVGGSGNVTIEAIQGTITKRFRVSIAGGSCREDPVIVTANDTFVQRTPVIECSGGVFNVRFFNGLGDTFWWDFQIVMFRG